MRLNPYGIGQPKVICSTLLLELGEADSTSDSPSPPVCLAGPIEIPEGLLICAFRVFRPPRAVAGLLLPHVPHPMQFHRVRYRRFAVASRPGLQRRLDLLESPVPSITSTASVRGKPTSLDVGRIELIAKRLIDDHDVFYPKPPTTCPGM
jgi:hypothetical protein